MLRLPKLAALGAILLRTPQTPGAKFPDQCVERTWRTDAIILLDDGSHGRAGRMSVCSAQRIWRAHGLQPHQVRQFKLSCDAEFVGGSEISSSSMSARRATRLGSVSMRRARSGRSTGPSR